MTETIGMTQVSSTRTTRGNKICGSLIPSLLSIYVDESVHLTVNSIKENNMDMLNTGNIDTTMAHRPDDGL